ncbi:MAG: Trans-aconitate 2-methyltransferase [Phycisphaerales bacterium]|nr:Trans-aconitate 2-methyltransferase [Phycisphaerales bacterium]
MPTWDSAQYLRFADERTRPCLDLAGRVELVAPATVIDLGCGPGNSTAVLAARWPAARITGLDSSAAMIEAARREFPGRRWAVGDIASWAGESGGERYDLVFSNAAMQWVDDHATAYPQIFRRVAPGGALATQVPGNLDAPAHTLMRDLAASESWRRKFTHEVREWHVHELPFYYDVLAPLAGRIELWTTEYVHVMPNAEAIVEWYRGSGLRPFLDALPTDSDRAGFMAEYLALIREAFPSRADGRVLFPFRRLFVVACSREEAGLPLPRTRGRGQG